MTTSNNFPNLRDKPEIEESISIDKELLDTTLSYLKGRLSTKLDKQEFDSELVAVSKLLCQFGGAR